MDQIIIYFTEDPLRILYLIGGSGGLWFWVNEWRNRTRIKISMLSETFDTEINPNINIETKLEITNLGNSVTSIGSSITVKALTPERNVVFYQFIVSSPERSLMPHEPKTITLSTTCDAKYAFTWFRTYSVGLSRGLSTTLRTKNTSNKPLSLWQYYFGYYLFKIFGWLPGNA